MNIYLIEKILKFKYLSNFVSKSKKTLCFYTLGLKKRSSIKEGFKILQISRNFLKLFLSSTSVIKWSWSLLFKGSFSLVSLFNYNIDLKIIKNFLKQNIVVGGFLRNVFFSSSAFKWFFFYLGKDIEDLSIFRSLHFQKIIKLLYFLSIKLFLTLYSCLKIFYFKLFNVYFNSTD